MAVEPKIITFISYKGGVGRSISLANTAYALAELGKKVGCIDLDLDAPGLRLIFDIQHTPPDSLTTASIFASGRVLSVDEAVLEVSLKNGGAIFLLPAINQGEVVGTIQWYDRAKILTIFQSVCSNYFKARNLDVLLIDSKAGLGKASALAARLATLLVCVFRIDRQCIEGTKWIHKVLTSYGKHALYLPSMVPNIEKAKRILIDLRNQLSLETPIPYSQGMVIDEKVVVRDSPKSKSADIYRRFAERILSVL